MLTGLFGFSLLLFALALIVAVYIPGRGTKRIGLSDLWNFRGEIRRGAYVTVGVIGFAIKHNIDRAVATILFPERTLSS